LPRLPCVKGAVAKRLRDCQGGFWLYGRAMLAPTVVPITSSLFTITYYLSYRALERNCLAENFDTVKLAVHIDERGVSRVFGGENELTFIGVEVYSF